MGTRHDFLIIDDDAWTRYALAGILRRKGWTVASAATLEEGLALVDAEPDCVVLDLGLPDGNGEAVLRKVREEGLSSRVVVCSVVSDARRIEGLRSLQPDAILMKPIDVEDVLHACCRS